MNYAVPTLILVVFAIYYFNGAETIINPTAQQALSNRAFITFFIYVSVLLAVILVSLQTKSMYIFFMMLTFLSFLWFIFGKTWQYSPQ